MDPVEREERRAEICREFRGSGMTRKAFCESREIALSTLGYWLKRLPKPTPRKQRSGFVPLGTVELSQPAVLRIRLGGEVVADLDLPADKDLLGDVLRAAASL